MIDPDATKWDKMNSRQDELMRQTIFSPNNNYPQSAFKSSTPIKNPPTLFGPSISKHGSFNSIKDVSIRRESIVTDRKLSLNSLMPLLKPIESRIKSPNIANRIFFPREIPNWVLLVAMIVWILIAITLLVVTAFAYVYPAADSGYSCQYFDDS
jgi:hypothetical protein